MKADFWNELVALVPPENRAALDRWRDRWVVEHTDTQIVNPFALTRYQIDLKKAVEFQIRRRIAEGIDLEIEERRIPLPLFSKVTKASYLAEPEFPSDLEIRGRLFCLRHSPDPRIPLLGGLS